MSYLGIFGLEFKSDVVIFEISSLDFVWLQNFVKKLKCLDLGPKMPYLDILGIKSSKNYCRIWNQHPRIRQTAKFCEKMKMPKFGTKNDWLEYFCPGT